MEQNEHKEANITQRPQKQQIPPNEFFNCQVCQIQVTTKKRYKALICEACKRFYLRNCKTPNDLQCFTGRFDCLLSSTVNQLAATNEDYTMTKAGSVLRTMCPACRLQRCQAVELQMKNCRATPQRASFSGSIQKNKSNRANNVYSVPPPFVNAAVTSSTAVVDEDRTVGSLMFSNSSNAILTNYLNAFSLHTNNHVPAILSPLTVDANRTTSLLADQIRSTFQFHLLAKQYTERLAAEFEAAKLANAMHFLQNSMTAVTTAGNDTDSTIMVTPSSAFLSTTLGSSQYQRAGSC